MQFNNKQEIQQTLNGLRETREWCHSMLLKILAKGEERIEELSTEPRPTSKTLKEINGWHKAKLDAQKTLTKLKLRMC